MYHNRLQETLSLKQSTTADADKLVIWKNFVSDGLPLHSGDKTTYKHDCVSRCGEKKQEDGKKDKEDLKNEE